MATVDLSEGIITTNNAKDVWYVATESAPASGVSYDFANIIAKDWFIDYWKESTNSDKLKIKLEEVSISKDHMAELEELFEI